jgi:hypothetical protein
MDVPGITRITHRKYTRMKNFADGVRGYLFQGRFSSCVLDEPPPDGSRALRSWNLQWCRDSILRMHNYT